MLVRLFQMKEAPSAVHVNMRHGTVLSLRGTASGLLFAAQLSEAEVLSLLAQEPADSPPSARDTTATRARPQRLDAALKAALAEARTHGISRAVDGSVPGVSAMAAPVFDERGNMVLSLTAIGPSAIFDTRLEGPVALALRSAAKMLSRQLGAREG